MHDRRQLDLIRRSSEALRNELPQLSEPLRKLLARLEGAPLPCVGVVHLACPQCERQERRAFRCGPRCPLCGGKGAPKRLETLIPQAPVRHWSLSLPAQMRARLALDHLLARKVGRAFVRAVFAHLRRKARRELGLVRVECGAVNVTQRFGGALDANVHFHAIVLDGVYTRGAQDPAAHKDGGPPHFHSLPAPDLAERSWVLARARERVAELFRASNLPAQLHQDLARVHALAATAAIDKSESPQSVGPTKAGPVTDSSSSSADPHTRLGGFSLDAAEGIEAEDRGGLRRLCRYVTRAPLSPRKLAASSEPDAKLRLQLSRAWDDGTEALEFTPSRLAARLLALMPSGAPTHAVAYHGVLAPNAALRWRLRPPSTQLPLAIGEIPAGISTPPARAPSPAPAPPRGEGARSSPSPDPSESLRCRRCEGQLMIVAVEDATDVPAIADG